MNQRCKNLNRTTIFVVLLLFLNLNSYSFNNLIDSLLTKKELNWLENHKNSISYSASPSWYPGEYIDADGQHQGIVSDYIKIFEKQLGVKFKFVPSVSFDQMLTSLLDDKVDFVGAISAVPERKKHLLFSNSYIEIPQLIVIRDDYSRIISDDNINDMSLAGVKGYASVKYIRETYPETKIIDCEDDLSALLMTSLGRTDGTIIDKMTANYLISKYGLSNLSLGVTLNYPMDVRFACQKDEPQLISIFNKLLNTIDEEQRNNINKKWVVPLDIRNLNFIQRNYLSFTYAGLALLTVLVLAAFYVVSLNRLVSKRTKDLQMEIEKRNNALKIAEEANKLKTSFLSNLSHEIRTPMNGIINCSAFLKEESISRIELLEFTDIIEELGQHLLNIIDDILEISRLETNQLSIANTKFDFNEFVNHIYQRFKLETEKKGLDFELQRPTSQELKITTDKTKLRQIISNLVVNALKFTNQGTIIIGYKLYDSCLEFFVKDTGIGVAEEYHQLIFEKFRQVDSSAKRNFGGNGIGLSIVKGYLELLGGSISLDSEVGKGSTFSIIIPIHEQ